MNSNNFLMFKNNKSINAICAILSIGFLLGLWEYSALLGWEKMKMFPPPSAFLTELYKDDFKIGIASQATSIPLSILLSIFRVVVGLVLGFFLAFVLGFFISTSVWIKRFVSPIIRILAPIAPVAWIPLALVLFGIGNSAAVFIVFMGVFFMLNIATISAIENVPENLINSAKVLGANKYEIWLKVIFPSIIPNVFTILRLNFIAAWMAVLAAEMTGLSDGLGAIIMTGRNLFNNKMILLGMMLIAITGFLFDYVLKGIQKKFFWWGNK